MYIKKYIANMVYLAIYSLGKKRKIQCTSTLCLFLAPSAQWYFDKLVSEFENVYKVIWQV